jgi:hypothetical protein
MSAMRQGARCELLRDNLGHANIDVTQNIFARAGGKSEWMRDMVGGGENANCRNIPVTLTDGGAVFANCCVKCSCWTRVCWATRMEETLADKSPEFKVASEDDVDCFAGWGGRDSGRPFRPEAFAMGGFDYSAYSSVHIISCHSSHYQSREARRSDWALELRNGFPADRSGSHPSAEPNGTSDARRG